jgi:hypothetical protein
MWRMWVLRRGGMLFIRSPRWLQAMMLGTALWFVGRRLRHRLA